MKGRRFLQITLGIVSAVITLIVGAVGVLCLLTSLPAFAQSGFGGLLSNIKTGVGEIATTFGLSGLDYVVDCVMLLLPTVLMLIATNCLLFAKKDSGRVAGIVLGIVAIALLCGLCGWFSKQLFGDKQMLILIVLCATAVVYLALAVALAIVCKKVKAKVVGQEEGQVDGAQTEEIVDEDIAEQPIEQPVEQTLVQPIEQPQAEVEAEAPAETAVDVEPTVEAPEQPTGEVLFMAQDYSSVSDITESTYEHNEVLSKVVLEKLRIARDLYEKGAITKDEYLSIVQKYLESAQ